MKKILLIVAFICIHTSANAKTFNECSYELHQLNNELKIDAAIYAFLMDKPSVAIEFITEIELYHNEKTEKWLEGYLEKALHKGLNRENLEKKIVNKEKIYKALEKECDRILEKEMGIK